MTSSLAHFNGKLEAPALYSSPLCDQGSLVASWDFSREPSGTEIVDTSSNGWNGHIVNFPARAMTGWNWQGVNEVFHHAPGEYGAIHFHDDDLEDCGWEKDFELAVPAGMKSRRAITSATGATRSPHALKRASEAATTKNTRKMVERRYCICVMAFHFHYRGPAICRNTGKYQRSVFAGRQFQKLVYSASAPSGP